MYSLGIDTSCYTTSVALINDKQELLFDGRKMLEVPLGDRGLRQSDAFYKHAGNLSDLIEECFKNYDSAKVTSITASSRPRNNKTSYMPVFLAGLSTARIIASTKGLPLNRISHQQNHILAGVWSADKKLNTEFWAYHISGGTTELLDIHIESDEMNIQLAGGSRDLQAGQFIDRVGVALGLSFPSGKELDKLSRTGEQELKVPVSVDGSYLSFSGPESHIQRLIKEDSGRKAEIARGLFNCIALSIEKTIVNCISRSDHKQILMVGGVASNSMIRDYLTGSKKLKANGIDIAFAEALYASDNAAGCALYGIKNSFRLEV